MFTGIIEETGTIHSVTRKQNGLSIVCGARKILEDVKVGDSIAIDGVCQTVETFTENSFTVFVSRISGSITTLGKITAGAVVNLERALTLSGRLGGHIVQGHVDSMGTVRFSNRIENGFELAVSVDHPGYSCVAEKGSIAVNGVSLTVVKREENFFTLYLIPESMRNTNLINLKRGDTVNLEFDILAKYVEQLLGKEKKPDILEIMKKSGFM